jgi:hypothetical protein
MDSVANPCNKAAALGEPRAYLGPTDRNRTRSRQSFEKKLTFANFALE